MKMGDYAHIPGGGPAHAVCGDCHHIARAPKSTGRCQKAAAIRGVELRKLEPFPSQSRACKYFERAAA